MALVYFDASALVKLLLAETGEDVAVELWNGCDAAVSSRLVYPEVCSALAAAHRNGRLDSGQLTAALREWDGYWLQLRTMELTPPIGSQAGRLVRTYPLSGADSVHLASALAFAAADPVVASWDGRLASAAAAEGLRVVPAG